MSQLDLLAELKEFKLERFAVLCGVQSSWEASNPAALLLM